MQQARSHLVPTTVTDKNGKLTTVYRRPSEITRAFSMFPAPDRTMAGLEANATVGLAAVQRLLDCGVLRGGEPQDKALKNLRALAKVSQSILEELVVHIERAGDDEKRFWEWQLSSQNLDPDEFYVGRDVDLEGGDYYRRYMAVAGIAIRITKGIKGVPTTTAAGSVIIEAARLIDDDYGDSYERLKAAVIITGLNYLTALDNNGQAPRQHLETVDIKFASENIVAVEAVLDDLIARRTAAPEVIAQLVGSHGALAAGNL